MNTPSTAITAAAFSHLFLNAHTKLYTIISNSRNHWQNPYKTVIFIFKIKLRNDIFHNHRIIYCQKQKYRISDENPGTFFYVPRLTYTRGQLQKGMDTTRIPSTASYRLSQISAPVLQSLHVPYFSSFKMPPAG